MIVVFTIISFFCGSLMFSYWLGLIAGKNIRNVGDGNPGAFNLWQAAGYKLGIFGIFLDFMKGYFPLAVLLRQGFINGMEIVPVGLAAILGHAFSPFMRLKGGKGIAVTFGVWSAVTRFNASIAYAVILAVILVIAKIMNKGEPTSTELDGVMVVLGMYILGLYLFIKGLPGYLLKLWFGNSIILTYKNKAKLYAFFKPIYDKQGEKNMTTRF